MAGPRYDPIDTHMIEAPVSKKGIAQRLDEDDPESYREDDALLVDLPDNDEI